LALSRGGRVTPTTDHPADDAYAKPEPPTLHVIEGDGFVVLGLQGEFDLYLAPQIENHARRALIEQRGLVLDLSDATFIDSTVVRTLLQTHRAASEQGLACVMQLGTAAIVERVIELTGLEHQIPRAHNRTEALHLLRHETRPPHS
jgi:anti-sigma B factor antagonist